MIRIAGVVAFVLSVTNGCLAADAPVIRVGIIGLDTSHVIAFTKEMNNPKAEGDLKDVEVVAAFPGGSPDIASSRDRVEGFTKQLKDMGVEIVDSIEALLPKVDAVLLESVDGRVHRSQAELVFRAKKPVFIDKPMAARLEDVVAIQRMAKEYNTPMFSCSSLRFCEGIRDAAANPKTGPVVGAYAYSPCSLEPTHTELYWYGIHGVESLFTIMGPGCESVQRTSTPDFDVVTGVWKDGRIGTFRGGRAGKSGYGVVVFGQKDNAMINPKVGYGPLVLEIAKFFKSGQAPVDPVATLEIHAFMTAADESKRANGSPVTLQSVISKAETTASDPK